MMAPLGIMKTFMRAVTLSPTMGRFLDMVNNDKTEPGSGLNPNENYPREFLQLSFCGNDVTQSGRVGPGRFQREPYSLPMIKTSFSIFPG